MKVPIFDHLVVRPLSYIGLTGGFWDIHLDSLCFTWIGMLFLMGSVLVGRHYLAQRDGSNNAFAFALEKAIDFFADLCKESFGVFRYDHFSFITALFFFVFSCNIVSVFPFVEESTRDLNTTLAIALMSFFYVQYHTILHVGLKGYIKEFFQPVFIFLPLNIIDKCAKVISMSFRLFGNILGGSIVFYLLVYVVHLYQELFILVALISFSSSYALSYIPDESRWHWLIKPFKWLNLCFFSLAATQMFFSVFEGAIQAFVIAMLTITYLSLASPDKAEGSLS
jgi:F-type H+-transporting ATPase subunit a